jgi:hypothetical protein
MEEMATEQWILSLDRRGFSPNLNIVVDIANLLLVQCYLLLAKGSMVVGKC